MAAETPFPNTAGGGNGVGLHDEEREDDTAPDIQASILLALCG